MGNNSSRQEGKTHAQILSGGVAIGGLLLLFVPGVQLLGSVLLSSGTSGVVNTIKQKRNRNSEFKLKSFLIDFGVGAMTGALTLGAGTLGKAAAETVKTCAFGVNTCVTGAGTAVAQGVGSAVSQKMHKGRVDVKETLKASLTGGISGLSGAAISLALSSASSSISSKFSSEILKEVITIIGGGIASGLTGSLTSIIINILKKKKLTLEDFIDFMNIVDPNLSLVAIENLYERLILIRVLSQEGHILKSHIDALELGQYTPQINMLLKDLSTILNSEVLYSAIIGFCIGCITASAQCTKSKGSVNQQRNYKKPDDSPPDGDGSPPFGDDSPAFGSPACGSCPAQLMQRNIEVGGHVEEQHPSYGSSILNLLRNVLNSILNLANLAQNHNHGQNNLNVMALN